MSESVLFGRYRLVEPLGAGGSAEVWRALDERTGDDVAVKRLHPIVFADEGGRRRLRREFEALRALDDRRIVPVRALHVAGNDAALILDYVAGRSLAERLADGPPFEPAEAVAVASDVAGALAAAHAAGIVHRDVTPGNILLPEAGADAEPRADDAPRALLTDFGIARASTDATAVTDVGQVVGTLRYVAPEVLRGEPATPAADLHALAAVTYEMLAGYPAYVATTPVGLAEAHVFGPPRLEGVAPALDAAVRRAMASDPADRPPDVRTFAEQLEAALADAPTEVFAVPWPSELEMEEEPARAGTAVEPATDRRRAVVPLAALTAVLVAAVGLAAGGPGDPAASRASPEPSLPAAVSAAPSSVAPSVTPAPVVDRKDDDKPKRKGNNGNSKGKGPG